MSLGLRLAFRLTGQQTEVSLLTVLNGITLHLQSAPCVDQVRFEDLYAPKEVARDYVKAVLRAQKLLETPPDFVAVLERNSMTSECLTSILDSMSCSEFEQDIINDTGGSLWIMIPQPIVR